MVGCGGRLHRNTAHISCPQTSPATSVPLDKSAVSPPVIHSVFHHLLGHQMGSMDPHLRLVPCPLCVYVLGPSRPIQPHPCG